MKTIIRLSGLTKVYRVGGERIRALDDVDLEVCENEYVSVMGPSGSGKSTLMNMLGCLDRADSGRYELDGSEVTSLNDASLARIRNERIGFVFQSFELLPRSSALQNVAMPLTYSREGFWKAKDFAYEALSRVGLAERVGHKPNQLSGGERQRVAIARALICRPSILLADEPTGNLDSRTSDEILELFGKLHDEGQTIIIVTHEESVAGKTSRVVRMRDGKVCSDLPIGEDSAAERKEDGK